MLNRDPSASPPPGIPQRAGPLRFADRLTLPVGQNTPIFRPVPGMLEQAIRDAVASAGFSVVESTLGASAPPPPAMRDSSGRLIGERNVRRVATSRSMRISVVVLVAAGAGLGGLDLIVGGSWIYAVPWVVVAAIGAFVLWLRYGRSYESEVIAVAVHPETGPQNSRVASVADTPSAILQWTAGRIRSVAFAGSRAAVDVKDCPVPLMEAVGRVVRRFEVREG